MEGGKARLYILGRECLVAKSLDSLERFSMWGVCDLAFYFESVGGVCFHDRLPTSRSTQKEVQRGLAIAKHCERNRGAIRGQQLS